MSSKRYPDEFKIEAVKRVVELGYPVAEVAKRLGITTHSLYAWKKKFGPDSVEHNEKVSAEKEIRRLKKELKRVTDKRDIYLLPQPPFAGPPTVSAAGRASKRLLRAVQAAAFGAATATTTPLPRASFSYSSVSGSSGTSTQRGAMQEPTSSTTLRCSTITNGDTVLMNCCRR